MPERDTETSDPVVAALESLRVSAPTSLTGDVLVAAGVADRYGVFEAPVGLVYVAFNDQGISAVVPAESAADFEQAFREVFGRPAVASDDIPERVARGVRRALETGKVGTLRLDLGGLSEFQQAVLRKAAEIPPGEVRPYAWIAREIGKPGAVRAVGTALGRNPVPVIVPCHRVVRSDGTVGEYAYGPEMKRSLLRAEGLDPDRMEEDAANGLRFSGSDTTKIYCHPTCRHARRVTVRHQRWFSSANEAADEGYRPCKVCRPEAAAA